MPNTRCGCWCRASAVAYVDLRPNHFNSQITVGNTLAPELTWLCRRLRPFFAWHLASFLCLAAASTLALLNPLILMWVIDRVLPRHNLDLILLSSVLLFVSYEGKVILSSLSSYLTLLATQRSALSMRMEVLRHLDSLSFDFHESQPVGARIYPLQEPIEELSYFGSDLFPAISRTILLTAFTIIAMLALSTPLTLLILPSIPAFLVARYRLRNILEQRADNAQRCRVNLSAFLQEHISSIGQIQLLQQEKHQERRAFCMFANAARSQVKLTLAGVQFTICTSLPIAAAAACILGFGTWTVLRGKLTAGGLIALYTYAFQLFEPLTNTVEMYSRAQRMFSSIRQIQRTLSLSPSITDSHGFITHSQAVSEHIVFRNVKFGYQRHKNILTLPHLSIPSGELVGVVGRNGAGKSTFAKLVARLYETSAGSIMIGASEIRAIPLEVLRSRVAYVAGTPVLFDGTLMDNLRLGNHTATIGELREVADLVGLTAFINSLPKGWTQPLGPGGHLLSGGQRQAVALARALLRKPHIAILDEATSALDAPTELLVIQRIPKFLSGVTLLFISHRLTNIAFLDRVLVFDAGRVAEDGTHNSLHKSARFYTELLRASNNMNSGTRS